MRKIVGVILAALIAFPPGIYAQEQAQLKTRDLSSVMTMPTRYTAIPDASVSGKEAMVRQAVAALGVGKNVDLKMGSRRIRATIASIEPDGFTIVRGTKPTTRDRIAYSNVQQIKPAGTGMSPKAALLAVVVIGAIALITWIAVSGSD